MFHGCLPNSLREPGAVVLVGYDVYRDRVIVETEAGQEVVFINARDLNEQMRLPA